MNLLIYNILQRIYKLIGKSLRKYYLVSNEKLLSSASKYPIEKNLSNYIFRVIKPITAEKVKLIPIYQVMHQGVLELQSASHICYRVENALIRPNADYIIVDNKKAIWSKRNLQLFTKNVPQDQDMLNHTEDSIVVRISKSEVREYNKVYSLCGVYSDVWSHFMLQYLVKLYSIMQLPKDVLSDLTILTPNYTDAHIQEVVNRFIRQYLPNIKLATLAKNEMATCKRLYWMDNTTDMIEHVSYVCPFDMITPAYVAQQMRQFFIPAIESNTTEGVKLYITRHGQWRNMTNNDEVEAYFKSIGFQVIEAHKLDYDSKTRLFQNAKEIVGPYSSGFANLVFCRPGTKVLIFSNVQRTLENFLAFYVQNFQLDAMYVTGKDQTPSDPDSPFTISLSRIKSAYQELIK